MGRPTQNGLVEHFIRTLKQEHVDFSDCYGYDDALSKIGHWLEVESMTQCIRSALDYLAPAEFQAQLLTA